jgi:hypothetical protein
VVPVDRLQAATSVAASMAHSANAHFNCIVTPPRADANRIAMGRWIPCVG